MLEFQKKNEYEYTCQVDNYSMNKILGKDISQTLDDVHATHELINITIEELVHKYELSKEKHNFGVQIYKFRTDSKENENLTIVIHLNPAYNLSDNSDEDDIEDYDGYSDGMQYSGNASEDEWSNGPADEDVKLYKFAYMTKNIEDIISVHSTYNVFEYCNHRLYYINNRYVIYMTDVHDLSLEVQYDLRSLLSEYTTPAYNVSLYYLDEYAKFITDDIPTMVNVLVGK